MSQAQRGTTLTIFAVLFALLAMSNMLKPLQIGGDHTGFVFFGVRLTGMANTIVGPVFGLFLLLYASGIWRMKRFAMPMAHAYATYVVINLGRFAYINPREGGAAETMFLLAYTVVAVGVSVGAAVILTKRKSELD